MKSFKLTAVTIVFVTAFTQAQADQTNIVQALHIHLSAMKQGGTTTNRNVVVTSVDTDRLDTRQIVGGIGTVLGDTFSPLSRLVLVTPVGGSTSSLEIRDRNS